MLAPRPHLDGRYRLLALVDLLLCSRFAARLRWRERARKPRILGRRQITFGSGGFLHVGSNGTAVRSHRRRNFFRGCRRDLRWIERIADHLRDQATDIVERAERTESGNRIRIVEVPLVLRDTDEVADRSEERRVGKEGRSRGGPYH